MIYSYHAQELFGSQIPVTTAGFHFGSSADCIPIAVLVNYLPVKVIHSKPKPSSLVTGTCDPLA